MNFQHLNVANYFILFILLFGCVTYEQKNSEADFHKVSLKDECRSLPDVRSEVTTVGLYTLWNVAGGGKNDHNYVISFREKDCVFSFNQDASFTIDIDGLQRSISVLPTLSSSFEIVPPPNVIKVGNFSVVPATHSNQLTNKLASSFLESCTAQKKQCEYEFNSWAKENIAILRTETARYSLVEGQVFIQVESVK